MNMKYDDFSLGLKKFISTRADISEYQISDDTRLIASGIVDSLLLTEILIVVEDMLKCNIDIDNFKADSFSSIRIIFDHYGK